MIMPSRMLRDKLLKMKNSRNSRRSKKRRSKKQLLRPMVKKPRKKRSKRMVDQLSSKMENQVSSLSPFIQLQDQLLVRPELLSEVAHLLCSKLNTPNPNVDLEKMLLVLLTLPAQADHESIMKKKDLISRESRFASNVRILHRFQLLNPMPQPLLYPLSVTLPTPAQITCNSSITNQSRSLLSNLSMVLRTVTQWFRSGVRTSRVSTMILSALSV